jgi:hypothetical protein
VADRFRLLAGTEVFELIAPKPTPAFTFPGTQFRFSSPSKKFDFAMRYIKLAHILTYVKYFQLTALQKDKS